MGMRVKCKVLEESRVCQSGIWLRLGMTGHTAKALVGKHIFITDEDPNAEPEAASQEVQRDIEAAVEAVALTVPCSFDSVMLSWDGEQWCASFRSGDGPFVLDRKPIPALNALAAIAAALAEPVLKPIVAMSASEIATEIEARFPELCGIDLSRADMDVVLAALRERDGE